MKKTICPVCGYDKLKPEIIDANGICPSCRFEFDITDLDLGYTYEQWREKWIKEGMKWNSRGIYPPDNWDPKRQLLNIGVKI
jgi:hypothetical protein